MKYFRCCFCLLLCCVLLLGAFSVNASAKTLDPKPYHVYISSFLKASGYSAEYDSMWIAPNDGVLQRTESSMLINKSTFTNNNDWKVVNSYSIANDDGSHIVLKGASTTISIAKIYSKVSVYSGDLTRKVELSTPSSYYMNVIYDDNTGDWFTGKATPISGTKNLDYTFTFTPNKNVRKIVLYFEVFITTDFGLYTDDLIRIYSHVGEWDSDNSYYLTIDQQSEESGILTGISGFVSNIFSSVSQGFTDVKNSISNIFNSIAELPQKIWNAIENGLKSLFVPNEEEIKELKNNWDSLLQNKLGAVYQVANVILESWERITDNDETNTIYIPEVNLPLPNNVKFTFGGYQVNIVPERFEVIVTALKTISGVVCTIMFVNGLRKRYDEVMGG